MPALVDTIWANGKWADTVWGADVWGPFGGAPNVWEGGIWAEGVWAVNVWGAAASNPPPAPSDPERGIIVGPIEPILDNPIKPPLS